MSISEPDPSLPLPERATPDNLLHTRTEDMVLVAGRDLTPRNLEWARRKLAAEGPDSIEKLLP